MRLRLLPAFLVTSCAFAAIAVACSDETTSSSPSTLDASADGSARADSGEEEEQDATTGAPDGGAKDATADAKPARDANGPGEAGADCVFNHDCQLAFRCECDEGLCACAPGARGTGKNGVDGCDAGEDCASSLCVEGPGDSGAHYCSDECASNVDCTGMLPTCKAITFIGKICVRNGG